MPNTKRFLNDCVLFRGNEIDKILGRIFWGI